MIVTARPDAVERVLAALAERGVWVSRVERSRGPERVAHCVVAHHSAAVDVDELAHLDGVLSVSTSSSEHPKVDALGSVATVAGVRFGDGAPVFLCGPCSVESEAHARDAAQRLVALGVQFLRGGAFKPRTSPYAFQGHGEPALGWLRRAADEAGLRVVTEVMSEAEVTLVAEHADLVQVGSRNMHDYALLKAVGRTRRPVLLKRGMAATIEEWLCAGEHLLASGASQVVFCERGLRSFDRATRNLLDLGAVALLAHVHRLPVVVDPSHAAGRRDLVPPLGLAALAAGATGLVIETHDAPGQAQSDGPQALSTRELAKLVATARARAQETPAP